MDMNRPFIRLRANFKRNIAISLGFNRVNCNFRQNFRYKKPAGAISSFNRQLFTKAVETSIGELEAFLIKEEPFCTGVVPLDKNNSQLFYHDAADGSSRYYT